LKAANNGEVGHTIDPFTKRAALFSGIEVKAKGGDKEEAEVQLSVWMAASLRKKADLAKHVLPKVPPRGAEANVGASETDTGDANRACDADTGNVDVDDKDGDADTNRPNPDPADAPPTADAALLTTLPEPALIIVGHDYYVYYASLDSAATLHLLGPDTDRFSKASTRSIHGIFALIRLFGRILEYGMDEKAFGGWILGQVLEKLAIAAHR
jgi:hypothetical protein